MIPALDGRHLAFALWLTCVAGLTVVVGRQTDWGRAIQLDPPRAAVLKPEKVDVALLGEYSLPSMDRKYPHTLGRPLFVPTRRPAPPPPPPPPPPKPTMQKGQFQMVGALILPETSFVWLRDVASGKTRRVEKGQSINGILVQEVAAEEVTLAQYDDTERVAMKVAPSPAGLPKPAAGAAATPAAGGGSVGFQPLPGAAPDQRPLKLRRLGKQ
jgi:hypothetical protein